MALQIIKGTYTGSLSTGDNNGYLIQTGSFVDSTGTAVTGTGSNHQVILQGQVEGDVAGIVLGDNASEDHGIDIEIMSAGWVNGIQQEGIRINAFDSWLTNAGSVFGVRYGVEMNGETGVSHIINSGSIQGQEMGIRSSGTQTLIIDNSGIIGGDGHAIGTYGGVTALITNTGKIHGNLYLDSGSDLYDGVNGRISGPIDCFGGNDTIRAGLDNDTINGMGGDDSLSGGAGRDSITGSSENDTLNGGSGVDTLDGGTGNDRFYVVNAADVVLELVGNGSDYVLASTSYTLAAGAEVERISTTSSSGTSAINLTGNEFAQRIEGNAGSNSLVGGGGKDTIYGGAGVDKIRGGAAADVMQGGAGKDIFDFNLVSESGTTSTTRDVISDFKHAEDRIDLSTIDAIAGDGDDKFVFDATKGTSTKAVATGHVGWYQVDASGTADDYTIIRINNDGDSSIESTIALKGLISLTALDFIL